MQPFRINKHKQVVRFEANKDVMCVNKKTNLGILRLFPSLEKHISVGPEVKTPPAPGIPPRSWRAHAQTPRSQQGLALLISLYFFIFCIYFVNPDRVQCAPRL